MEAKEIALKLIGNIENYKKDMEGLEKAAEDMYKRAIIDTKQLAGEITDEEKLFSTLANIGDELYKPGNIILETLDYPAFYLFFKVIGRAIMIKKYGPDWFKLFLVEVNKQDVTGTN